jgi:predicted transcriptional regulator
MLNKKQNQESNNSLLSINISGLTEIIHQSVRESIFQALSEIQATKEKSNQTTENKLFTRVEILAKFKISSVSLWKLEKSGLIKGKRLGRKVFYYEDDIIQAMNQQTEAK